MGDIGCVDGDCCSCFSCPSAGSCLDVISFGGANSDGCLKLLVGIVTLHINARLAVVPRLPPPSATFSRPFVVPLTDQSILFLEPL